MVNKKEHIVISKETKEELDKLIISKSDTYDDIVRRLLSSKIK